MGDPVPNDATLVSALPQDISGGPFPPSRKQYLPRHLFKREAWVPPLGRCDCGESREEAAIRAADYWTGSKSHLFPVTMATRARNSEDQSAQDLRRTFSEAAGPFMSETQAVGAADVVVKSWYVAAIDERGESLGKNRWM